MKIISFVVLFVFVFAPIPLPAQLTSASSSALELTETAPSCGVCELAESESFAKSAPGKIERGVVNILLGWTNLFAQPIQAGKSGGSVWTGIGTGFSMLFTRTVQGVVELGLFWLPPSGGEPLKQCALGDLGITGR